MTDVLNLDKSKKDKDDEGTGEVPLFTIDGKTYSIPNKSRVNVALKYLKAARKDGPEMASGMLMEEMLGEEAYDALANYEDLTAEDLQQVIQAVQKVALGGLEDIETE